MDLLKEPVLESARFLYEPDAPSSLKELRDFLLERAAYDICTQQAKERKIERHEYVAMLDKEGMKKLMDLAEINSLESFTLLKNLVDRGQKATAYSILRKNSWQDLGGYDSFAALLADKLEHDPSRQSTEQIVFMLELIRSYESNASSRGFAKNIFNDKLTYGKMVAGIKPVRDKFMNFTNAKRAVDDQKTELTKSLTALRQKKSDALVSSASETELAQLDNRIAEKKAEIDLLEKNSAESLKNVEVDFLATTAAMVDLARSDVPRSAVAEALPKVTEVKLKQMGYDPAKISQDYDHLEQEKRKVKPIAQAIHLNGETIYVLKVKSHSTKIVNQLLEEMFDLHLAELDEGIKTLSAYKNPNKKH